MSKNIVMIDDVKDKRQKRWEARTFMGMVATLIQQAGFARKGLRDMPALKFAGLPLKFKEPEARPPEVRASKRAKRQARRSRIERRGWAVLIFFLLLTSVARAACLGEYDSQGHKLGVLYKVEVSAPTGTLVCGTWLDYGVPAKAPNADMAMDRYCRETKDGKIFFAIRLRGVEDCSEAAVRYLFDQE